MADPNILQDILETDTDPEDLQVQYVEVEQAIQSLKAGKSPNVDSMPAKLIKVT